MNDDSTLPADLLQRIVAEFREQPGLGLTQPQAQRLWALDERTCRSALTALVAAGVLQRSHDGRFRRRQPAA